MLKLIAIDKNVFNIILILFPVFFDNIIHIPGLFYSRVYA